MHGRPEPSTRGLDFLAGGGEMGALMRAHDWSATPLGLPEAWPGPLKTAVRLILNTGHPMYIWWGPDLLCFYNDAYCRTLGPERHPGSLGKPGREVWAEIWHLIGHQVDFVMAGHGSTWDENRPVPITRFGRLDEIYWTYSYSPIDDEKASEGVGGVLVVCTETTQAVLAEQQRAAEAERQRRLFEQAPGFMAILSGPEHVFQFANESFDRLFDRRGFIGKKAREAFPELDGQGFYELLDGVYATGERFVASAMPIRLQATAEAEPTDRFLDFIYEPMRDEDGAVTGIFVEGYDVTDRVRAEAVLREREEWQAFLLLINDALRPLSDPVEIQAEAARHLGEHLGSDRAYYVEVSETRGEFVVVRDWHRPGASSHAGRYPLEAWSMPWLASGKTWVVRDVATDPAMPDEQRDAYHRQEIGSLIVVPLLKDGRLLGTWLTNQRSPRSWTKAEIHLVEEVAARTWEAIERARAQVELREREARLSFLDRLGAETASLADADAVLSTTTRLLGEHLNLSVCAYADMNEDQDGFTIRGDWAAPGSMSIVGHYRLADFGKLAVKNLSAGLPLVVNDNLRELAPEEAATFQSIGIAATICMPLVKEGRLTALMAIHDRVPRVWSDAELGLLREVTARSWAHVERVGAAAELRAREAHHRQILNSAIDYAIVATDMDGRVTSWNSGAQWVLGWTEEEMLGQSVDLFFTPEDVAAGQSRKEMEGALAEGWGIGERWHQRKTGERFWASGELTPLKDDFGAITGFVKVLRDRTEQRRTEDTLRQYGVLVESMSEGVSVSDENGVILYTNPAEDRMFGYAPGELVGQHVSVQNAYPPKKNIRRVEAVIAQLQASGSWDGEWLNRRKDGTEFITASRITAVAIEGRPHWLCVQRDITQAKQAEEHQRLLINELNHRVKNTLATVQSIASQTLRNAKTPEEARGALESRLFALSRAHNVLTRENWDGADLREIVAEAVEPYSNAGEDRLHLSGEAIRLPPRMALALAMALQELATNAVKYGGLSNATGEVRIAWSDGDERLHLTWSETGGPPVKVPSRRGFGTRLIERSLASDLDGEVRIRFEPAGLICTVDASLTQTEAPQVK